LKTDKCDVVVVGFGNAAQAAAYSALSAGAKVVVLEKAPENKRGGNTWFSTGAQFRHAHNGLADEKPLLPQISDDEFEKIDLDPYTKDDFYADLMRVTRGKAVPELAELLVNESHPTVKWMRDAGVEWDINYNGSVPEGDRFRWHHGQSFIHSKDGGTGLVQRGDPVQRGRPRLRRLRGQSGDAPAVPRRRLGPRKGARHQIQYR
jgi:tricarballylate dehydrogenase